MQPTSLLFKMEKIHMPKIASLQCILFVFLFIFFCEAESSNTESVCWRCVCVCIIKGVDYEWLIC
jgi:hypothetical protein